MDGGQRHLTGQVRETRCSQVLQLERQKIFCPGEQQEFPGHFDREELLRLFRAGRHWLCAEYRRTDGGGSIRWVRHILYLAEEPDFQASYQPELLKGVVAVRAQGKRVSQAGWGPERLYRTYTGKRYTEAALTFIPYYAWANRTPGEMLVWVRI